MTRMSYRLMFTLALLSHFPAYARETFNIHALELDSTGQDNVDLSVFTQGDGHAPGIYLVSVYINGTSQGEEQNINFVRNAQGNLRPVITADMLKSWGVNINAFPPLSAKNNDMAVDNIEDIIPMASATLIFSQQRLNISIPQAAMNASVRDRVDPAQWDEGVPAALLNYSMSGNSTHSAGQQGVQNSYYSNLQSGLNFGTWRLRNYSTWNSDQNSGSRWASINTYLQRDIQFLRGQLTLGDSYTPSDVFDSVQFRGVQFSSDDNMLPDSQRGYAPVIRGIAQSNAQVTVKQNGYIIYQIAVAPGAFTISDLYPTSGSGDLEVTIKEADGRERKFSQPFSAVPVMQREGRLKYALTAGKYRSSDTHGDGPQFSQFTAIYGLPRMLTVYGGMLLAEKYRSGTSGLGGIFGILGSISADITVANATLNDNKTRDGKSFRVQFAKYIQSTGTGFTLAAYRYSTKGFYTFQEANDVSGDNSLWQMRYNKRQRMQLDINQNLGQYGSFFISGYQQDYWRQSGYERTLSAGWNGSIGNVNYGITYSYSKHPGSSRSGEQQLAFNVQVPLSRFLSDAWASYSVNTAKRGNTGQQIGLNGTALADNNLSYSLQQSYTNHGVGGSGNLNADYKGTYGDISAGYNYDNDRHQINYGLKGGIVAHPHGVTFAQPLGPSLAIVRAPGVDGAKVQNNTGVYTDWRGYAVVPYVTPYRINRIALDTSTLDDEVDINSAAQTVTPTQGAVVMVNFKTRIGRRVLMTLTYRGQPVPFGAQATPASGGSGIVSDGGQVYLTGMPDEGTIMVNWHGVQQCVVRYRLPADRQPQAVITTKQECQ